MFEAIFVSLAKPLRGGQYGFGSTWVSQVLFSCLKAGNPDLLTVRPQLAGRLPGRRQHIVTASRAARDILGKDRKLRCCLEAVTLTKDAPQALHFPG
jgi:hypothetical protein